MANSKRQDFKVQTVKMMDIDSIEENPQKLRLHDEKKLSALEKAVKKSKYLAAVVISNQKVYMGHARLIVARRLGLKQIPVIELTDFSEEELMALSIADNALVERGTWDKKALTVCIKELSIANKCRLGVNRP